MLNLRREDWGFHFDILNELDAYKAAYDYRHVRAGCVLEYIEATKMWHLTVFNDRGARLKFPGTNQW